MVSGRCSNSARNLRYSNRFHSSYSLRCKHLINPTSHKLAAAKTSWKFSIRPLILQHISRLWNGFDLTVFASDPTVRWKMMEDANLFIAYQKKSSKTWCESELCDSFKSIPSDTNVGQEPLDCTLLMGPSIRPSLGQFVQAKTRGSNGFLSFKKGAYIYIIDI